VKFLMSVVSFCLFSGATLVAHAEADNFIEPGRYGAEWAVTEDTVFIGPTYRGEKLEAAFFLSGHKMTDGAPVESWVVNARLGYRHNLGLHNYLSGGLLANYIVLGKDYGSGVGSTFNNTKSVQNVPAVDVAGAGRVGPYLAIQRQIPGSGVFFEVAVMVYAYQTNYMNDGAGNKISSHGNRFLESGYVGMGYLFGDEGSHSSSAN